ncbi:hypothetical protein Ancab_011374 [Ancistrocladus abbreviatus]
MGRRECERKVRAAKVDYDEDGGEEDSELPSKHNFTFSDSDDEDEEANEDLSLKIVQKAMSRASHVAPNDEDQVAMRNSPVAGNGGVGGGFIEDDVVTSELVVSTRNVKRKIKKEKKKFRKTEAAEARTVNIIKGGEKSETIKAVEVVNLSEPGTAENVDNVVLRRLLRGPRYFDPPDSSWGACFNCGEDGHSAANCTSAKRKKPCFICGSLEHGAKKCTKGQDCFICNEGGHRAKDCPKKFKRSSLGAELCLRCGAYGHAMSSCINNYSPDDLKEIQCYACKSFGHLCCVNYFDTTASEASCYKCGQSGHYGSDCRASRGEIAGVAPPSSCFVCGEEGHFARECSNSTKVKKRDREFSTPSWKSSKDGKGHRACKSATQDIGKTRKKEKLRYDEGYLTSSSQSKRKGGWITDDPGDFPWRKVSGSGWRSRATPIKNHRISSLTSGGYNSNFRSSKQTLNRFYPGTSNSPGSARTFQQRFSASRFGNSSSDGMRRNYDWW